MKLKISKYAQLYEICWVYKDEYIITRCLARDEKDAEKAFREEYEMEYPKDLKLEITQVTNEANISDILDPQLKARILMSTSLLIAI